MAKSTVRKPRRQKIAATGRKKAKGDRVPSSEWTEISSGPSKPFARFEDSESVVDLLGKHHPLEAAKIISADNESYFVLGGVLRAVYYPGVFRAAGYDKKRGFETYVKNELGLPYRKALALIEIYDVFRRAGVDEKQIGKLSWSKSRDLARQARKRDLTKRQLLSLIVSAQRDARSKPNGPAMARRSVADQPMRRSGTGR